jgi:ABC-type anion transport system duplicated permease subunit
MKLIELLKKTPDQILLEATDSLVRTNLEHYHPLKPENVRARLANLYFKVQECVKADNDQPMINFIHKVAEERLQEGFYIYEVQAAINILEESLWHQIVKEIIPEEQANALENIQGLLCVAKRELARTYIAHEKKVLS